MQNNQIKILKSKPCFKNLVPFDDNGVLPLSLWLALPYWLRSGAQQFQAIVGLAISNDQGLI